MNVMWLDRAVDVFDNVRKFVEEAMPLNNKPASSMKSPLQDPLMKCKMVS